MAPRSTVSLRRTSRPSSPCWAAGEPADAVTVSAELQRRAELIRLGGAPYLHTPIATVPTAANAAYHAEIVAEKATLRRLVEAGTRIVQLGYHEAEGAEVEEVVDRAQAAIYEVTERSTSEDYVPLEELLQPTVDPAPDWSAVLVACSRTQRPPLRPAGSGGNRWPLTSVETPPTSRPDW